MITYVHFPTAGDNNPLYPTNTNYIIYIHATGIISFTNDISNVLLPIADMHHIPGSSKNSHPMKYHTTEVMSPRPPIQCCLLNFVFGGLQKNSHLCWWCSALPITTLKLGVAGVSKVSLWFPLDGCLSWRTRWVFLVLSFFDCCWYACGCRSPHTHIHIHATTSASEIYALSKHALL